MSQAEASDITSSCSSGESMTAGMSEKQTQAAVVKSEEKGRWSELTVLSQLTDSDGVIWEQLKQQYPRFFKDTKEDYLRITQAVVDHHSLLIDMVKKGLLKTDKELEFPEERRDRLRKEYPAEDRVFKLGKKIGTGSQAKVYELQVNWLPNHDCVAKVFRKESFSLEYLQKHWSLATKNPSGSSDFVQGGPVFAEPLANCCLIYYGTFLEDGRFAFVMDKYWGDLRTYIDSKMSKSNNQGPPFSHSEALGIMLNIACGVKELHDRGVVHRDLKTPNILVKLAESGKIEKAIVADFETAMLIVGTGFWKAPEVWEELDKEEKDRNLDNVWTEKVDAYSFAMTYYEVLTGHIPFEKVYMIDSKRVIDGERPHLPDYVQDRTRALLERCWHKDPSERPTFEDIVKELCRA